MDTLQKALLIAHILIALGIIGLVLLQRGKGADAGAAFGAGASGTVFGSRGSGSFFSRATAVLATAFFASSLALAYLSSQRQEETESLIDADLISEDPAGDIPAIDDGAVDDDIPEIAPADEFNDVPALDDGSADVPDLEEAAEVDPDSGE